jgi:hypothetical protein
MDWGRTQNNLGNAYWNLHTHGDDNSVRDSIDCYSAALQVLTKEESPLEWAMVQHNLGVAYFVLNRGNRGEHLRFAIQCFSESLYVYDVTEFPLDWALAIANISLIQWSAAKEWDPGWTCYGWKCDVLWHHAETGLDGAIDQFQAIGHEHYARHFQQALADLRRDRDSHSPR